MTFNAFVEALSQFHWSIVRPMQTSTPSNACAALDFCVGISFSLLACRLSIHRLKAKCRLLTMSEQQTRDCCWWTLSFFLHYTTSSVRQTINSGFYGSFFLSLSHFVHSFINCYSFISCAGGRQRRNERETAQQSSWYCKRQARFYARGIARQTAHITQIGRKRAKKSSNWKWASIWHPMNTCCLGRAWCLHTVNGHTFGYK